MPVGNRYGPTAVAIVVSNPDDMTRLKAQLESY